jgi:NADP-dependent 3-hydroxy acid dehydrogenase YdfG
MFNAISVENIQVRQLDVTSEKSVERCVGDILREEGGRIDILINNAGYGLAGCLEAVSVAEAQKLFDVNVWGAVRVMQAVLPSMRRRRSGYIINVSSTSGIR